MTGHSEHAPAPDASDEALVDAYGSACARAKADPLTGKYVGSLNPDTARSALLARMARPVVSDELRRLSDAATAGEWFSRNGWIADHPGHGQHRKIIICKDATYSGSDSAFIAASVNYVRALLAGSVPLPAPNHPAPAEASAVAVLREVEWAGDKAILWPTCPRCGGQRPSGPYGIPGKGHRPDCRLAAALAAPAPAPAVSERAMAIAPGMLRAAEAALACQYAASGADEAKQFYEDIDLEAILRAALADGGQRDE